MGYTFWDDFTDAQYFEAMTFILYQIVNCSSLFLFQFESYNPENDRIKEVEFAEILMTYASLSDKQRKKKIKKVKQRFVGADADVSGSFFFFLDVQLHISFIY